MKFPVRMFGMAGIVLCGASLATAQQPAAAPMNIPKVITITREYVKPGRTAAHAKVEAAFANAFAMAKAQDRYLGMASVTGPDEAWFILGYDSYADMEKADNSIMQNAALMSQFARLAPVDGDLLTGSDRLIAQYREDLSYNPDTSDSLADKRYFDVEIIHVRPGHAREYEDLIKVIKTASDKANTGDHFATFEVVSGAPEGTLLFFSGRKSLAIYDQFDQMYGKKFNDALGDGGQKKMRELESSSVEKAEDRLFAFSPRMSYPPEAWIKADPAFWQPKPMTATVAVGVMKMTRKKTAAAPPPSQ
jgi:hypothetical protein